MAIVHLLAVSGTAILLCAKYRRKIEEILPVLCCLMMPVFLVLAMLRCLSLSDWLAVAFLLFVLIRAVVAMRQGRLTLAKARAFAQKYLLTPGLVCFVLLAVFFYWATSTRHVYDWDEFNYWGTAVRSLWVSDGLTDFAHSCTPTFSSYLPTMPALEWWFVRLSGGYHESAIYFGFFLCNALFLLPLARRITWRGWYWIPVFVGFAIVAPTMFSGGTYFQLASDNTMGFVFGYILYALWSARKGDRFSLLSVGASLCAMALLKQSGIVWVLAALLFWALVCRSRDHALPGKTCLWLFGGAGLCCLSWLLYCQFMGLSNYLMNFGLDTVQSLLHGQWTVPDFLGDIAAVMAYHTLRTPPNMSGVWEWMKAFAGLPLWAWLLLFSGVAFACVRLGKNTQSQITAWRIVWFVWLTAAVFWLVNLGSFLTLFKTEVQYYLTWPDRYPALLDRYWLPITYGFALFCSELVLERVSLSGSLLQKRRQSLLCFFCAAIMALSFSNWRTVKHLLPNYYAAAFPSRHGAEWRGSQPWVLSLPDPANTRVLTTRNDEASFDSYALPPLSILQISNDFTEDLPRDEWERYLDFYQVTHVMAHSAEDIHYPLMCRLFAQTIQPGSIYRLNRSTVPYSIELLPQT